MKKIFIILGILLLIFVIYITIYSYSKSDSIAEITKCNTDNGLMYLMNYNSIDAEELIIFNGKSISCNWAWGPSEECQNLPKHNSCKIIYASLNNIYGPTKVTAEGILTLMKYK